MKGLVVLNVVNLLNSIGADELLEKGGIGLLILLTLLQIAPIQLKPWSWLWSLVKRFFGWLGKSIGKSINGEVITELGEIKTRLSELEAHDDRQDTQRAEDKALDARRRILQFADEIRRKVRHSEEHFHNVFEDIKYYKTYCEEHKDFENDRARISIKIIEDTYEKCTRENDFL